MTFREVWRDYFGTDNRLAWFVVPVYLLLGVIPSEFVWSRHRWVMGDDRDYL